MKHLLILILSFICIQAPSQEVRLFEIKDTTWYGMDKPAATNIIKKAAKGSYFDNYVIASNNILDSVVKAKMRSDSIQILLQQDIGNCKYMLLETEKDLFRTHRSNNDLLKQNQKIKKRQWWLGGGLLGTLILLAITI